LIFDNVERYQDLDSYLPIGSHGHILLVTRYNSVALASHQKAIHLQPFNAPSNKQDAQVLFQRLLGWEEDEEIDQKQRDAAEKILNYMDGLALGIQQLASLITHRKQSRNVTGFLKLYEQYPHRWHMKGTSEETGRHTLHTLWQMSFKELRKHDSDHALTMLGVLACISPDLIHIDLFTSLAGTSLPNELGFCEDPFE
jgi:hypothetical protein